MWALVLHPATTMFPLGSMKLAAPWSSLPVTEVRTIPLGFTALAVTL